MDELDEYVDRLKKHKKCDDIPGFSTEDGRTEAQILFLLRDPGNSGAMQSRLVDRSNTGRTARNFRAVNDKVNLDRRLTITWNIVPWPADNEPPFARQVEDALPWLGKLLKLLPKLRVVALLGNDAIKATPFLYRCRPDLHVLHGPHPSLPYDKTQDRRAWLEATVYKARCLVQGSEFHLSHFGNEERRDIWQDA
jgi:uracil-DNA glycosylase